jgi:pimeloyl-ACP methyl ester carboxylesterase
VRHHIIPLLFLLFASVNVSADVLVLVHGYLSGAQTWDENGITQALDSQWQRGGVLVNGPYGVRKLQPAVASDNTYYIVDLPSEAPLMLQASHLEAMLAYVHERHPDEPLVLAAHSAGGIVARIALVHNKVADPKALITIAAPHVGTPKAMQALDASRVASIPFASFFGGAPVNTLKRSRGLYIDLLPPTHGNLLGWLNGQPHPDIDYVSIIRGSDTHNSGDELVPGYSQDMNNVISLRGKSETQYTPTGHQLEYRDAAILMSVLDRLTMD